VDGVIETGAHQPEEELSNCNPETGSKAKVVAGVDTAVAPAGKRQGLSYTQRPDAVMDRGADRIRLVSLPGKTTQAAGYVTGCL
jgi:hypothetical protein